MLKLLIARLRHLQKTQPPSGGCVLKQYPENNGSVVIIQPPSGGCVLKHCIYCTLFNYHSPAAFGRLRVETQPPAS